MSDEQRVDDLRLLEQSAGGDRQAFDRLADRHSPALGAMMRGILHDDAAADDALQDALLAAWRGASSFRAEASVKTWLFTLARHAAFRVRRQRVGAPAHFAQLDALDALGAAAGWGDTGFDPERAAALTEERATLRAALETLGTDDQEVIALRDLAELTGPEAAEVLEIPLAALKTRLLRARLRLVAAVRHHDQAGRSRHDA